MPDRIQHRGLVMSADIGTLGCTGSICSSAHAATPGVHVGGFFGGNVAGLVELGLAAGWGKLRPHVATGRNALSLYGIDPGELELADATSVFDVDSLAVLQAKMSVLELGPRLRLHFVRQGRLAVYMGAGFEYIRLRNDYTTAGGAVRFDFHGFAVPLHGGLEVFVLERLSVGLRFDYIWSYYAAIVAKSPQQTTALPLGMLQTALEGRADPQANLPHLWTAALGLRVTL
ncbi:MAG: hypothetical protein V3V08_00875 [Nannocystaceae bacterium]